MILETLLAALHLLAILTMVVFVSSTAAPCQPQWLNAPALERLARVQLIYVGAMLAVLLSGLARSIWGIKGSEWYWSAPLLHLKLSLLVLLVLLAIKPTLTVRNWRKTLRLSGTLPNAEQVLRTRRSIMGQAHLMALLAVLGVAFARGWWHA